jgi:hypothetical protein
MGLRFSCLAGGGWVAGMGRCVARFAYPREKSAANFRDTSIYRLVFQYMILWGLRLTLAQKTILVTGVVTLGRRAYCRVAL